MPRIPLSEIQTVPTDPLPPNRDLTLQSACPMLVPTSVTDWLPVGAVFDGVALLPSTESIVIANDRLPALANDVVTRTLQSRSTPDPDLHRTALADIQIVDSPPEMVNRAAGELPLENDEEPTTVTDALPVISPFDRAVLLGDGPSNVRTTEALPVCNPDDVEHER